MAKKTNKTSHILDLLTNGPAPEASAPKMVTVVDEGSRNDKLSQEILNNLSEELENEVQQESGEEPAALVNEQSQAPVQIPNMAELQNVAQADPEPEENLDIEPENLLQDADEEEYHFVNVMEELLAQQDLEGTMRQFDMCTCPRCNADVRALTLTALPAKYVVIGKDSYSPVLNYYENKFKINMLTALNKACSMVRQRPHHKR